MAFVLGLVGINKTNSVVGLAVLVINTETTFKIYFITQ